MVKPKVKPLKPKEPRVNFRVDERLRFEFIAACQVLKRGNITKVITKFMEEMRDEAIAANPSLYERLLENVISQRELQQVERAQKVVEAGELPEGYEEKPLVIVKNSPYSS